MNVSQEIRYIRIPASGTFHGIYRAQNYSKETSYKFKGIDHAPDHGNTFSIVHYGHHVLQKSKKQAVGGLDQSHPQCDRGQQGIIEQHRRRRSYEPRSYFTYRYYRIDVGIPFRSQPSGHTPERAKATDP